MNDLINIEDHGSQMPAQLVDKAREYIRASRSKATLRSYKTNFATFQKWCDDHGRCALPTTTDTMIMFLTDAADRYKAGTLNTIVSGIAFAHETAGHEFNRSAFATVLAGIRRTNGTAQRRVAAITVPELRRIVAALPDSIQGKRDRALLLIGFGAALRRSELVGLDIGAGSGTGTVEISDEGVRITLHKSKTDQEGAGQTVAIPRGGDLCPVAALEAWLEVAGISEGAIFRPVRKGGRIKGVRLTDQSVALVIKRVVTKAGIAAGMTESEAKRRATLVAGHSLRAGFATSAAAAGVTGENIARQTRHSSTAMVQRYVREAELFKNNPVRALGL